MSQKIKMSISNFNTLTLSDKVQKKRGFKSINRKSNSELLNPESFSTTLHLSNNINLPKISERKKTKKRGTFLQSWLDEALGEADTYITPQSVQKKLNSIEVDGGTLKTLKKFELDKRYLQSLNIPNQKVERLYQTLYIYSHGIDKVFQQILQFVQQYENKDLLGNFWKAFTKLLQSCTSYQTVFQKIEKDHLQNFVRLQNNIQVKSEEYSVEKKQLGSKITKLQKNLEEKNMKLNSLTQQYKVMESTLGLTDDAFNDEVHLRLKFEEKINAVYTSYEELKLKYQKIVQQMHIKKDDIAQKQQRENNLKVSLLQEKVKVQELQRRLTRQSEKVNERQVQLDIKRQQMEDMKQKLQAKLNKDQQATDFMEDHLSKYKALNVKYNQSLKVIKGQKLSIKSKQDQIDKFFVTLEDVKTKNNKLYEDNVEYGKIIVKLQSQILSRNLTIKQNQQKLTGLNFKGQKMSRELEQTEKQRSQLQNQNIALRRDMAASKDTREKNEKLIQDLKAVKDKYERINQILENRVTETNELMHSKSNELNIKIEEIQCLKLLLDTRTKTIGQMEKHNQKERQTYQVKASALNSAINKKQSIILDMQKTIEELKRNLTNLQANKKNLADKIIVRESEKLKIQIQLTGKTKQNKDLQVQLKLAQNRYQQLATNLQGELQSKRNTQAKLSSTSFVLNKRKEEQRIQIINLKTLMQQYKQIIDIKAQYIHPMAFEECRMLAIIAEQKQQHWKSEYSKAIQSNSNFERAIEKIKQTNEQLLVKIKTLEYQINNKESFKKQLTQQLNSYIIKHEKLSENYKKRQEEHIVLKNNFIEKQSIIEKNSLQLKLLKVQLEDQQKQKIKIASDNSKLIQSVNQYKIKEEQLKEKIQQKGEMCNEKQIQTDLRENLNSRNRNSQQQIQIGTQTEGQWQRDDDRDDDMEPRYSVFENPEISNRTQSHKKKIDKKDFKKALKLTYMRR